MWQREQFSVATFGYSQAEHGLPNDEKKECEPSWAWFPSALQQLLLCYLLSLPLFFRVASCVSNVSRARNVLLFSGAKRNSIGARVIPTVRNQNKGDELGTDVFHLATHPFTVEPPIFLLRQHHLPPTRSTLALSSIRATAMITT